MPGNCLHGVGGVVVDDNGAVFRNQLAEAVERMNDIINVLEEVQMVCIDIEPQRQPSGGS